MPGKYGYGQLNDNFLTASYLPGKHNIIADAESRKLSQGETEWKLNSNVVFHCAIQFWYCVGLF